MILRMLAMATLACVILQPAERDAAVIVNSGSTNRAGFRIAVDRSGAAEYTPAPRRRPGPQPVATEPVQKTVPRDLADRLYNDLKAASPLTALPAPHCMKSVSFGSTLIIELDGEQTPDLSCPDNGASALSHLIRDCDEIIALFNCH